MEAFKVHGGADVAPRVLNHGFYFAAMSEDGGRPYGWHQDYESYYLYQTHRNYVNLYIPVIKPDVARSNLQVVSALQMSKHCPELWRRLEWHGATRQFGKTLLRGPCCIST